MGRRYLFLLAVSGCADFAGIGDPKPLAPDAPPAPCNFAGIDLCLFAAPQNELTLSTDLQISTDRDCDIVYNKPLGRSACVIYARTITINAKITAAGQRPLILAATERIEVNGTVDVSGALTLTSNNTSLFRPAAANDSACINDLVDAAGAGGSFAGKGGDGGNNGSVRAFAAPAIPAPDYLRGGCGGAGGSQGFGFGTTPSGGAVALVSGGAVVVAGAGRVLANGAGGGGAVDMLAPAGGGGSGGMILLGAPSVTVEGIATANGGGGGEGTSSGLGNGGAAGTLTTMPALGGSGNPTAGDGGNGGAGTMISGTAGGEGTAPTGIYADGGGGGGAGFIIINGAELNRTGTLSPEPIRIP